MNRKTSFPIAAILFCCIALVQGCTSTISLTQQEHIQDWEKMQTTSLQKGQIVVRVKNITPETGKIRIGIYDAMLPFPQEGIHLTHLVVNAQSSEIAATFTNVPFGQYAVAVIHDADDNGKLNRILGMFPGEKTGYSNNAANGMFGPPSFRDAQFLFNSAEQTIEIRL